MVQKTIPEEKAKQGRWGGQVLVVLVVGLLLALAVWIGVGSYGEAIDNDSSAPTQTSN